MDSCPEACLAGVDKLIAFLRGELPPTRRNILIGRIAFYASMILFACMLGLILIGIE
jgi:hypothetical protein